MNHLANGFLKLGIVKNEVVNVHLFNSPDHLVTTMAALKIGAIACPINVQFTQDELVHQINDSRGVLLVTEKGLAGGSAVVRGKMKTIRHVIEIGDSVNSENLKYSDILAKEKPELAPFAISPNDNAIIFYTSGTTGNPKGSPLTHGNFVYMVDDVSKVVLNIPGSERKDGKSVRLVFMPMFNVNPLMHHLLGLARGDKMVLLRKFSVREFGPSVERERPDYFFGVPKVYKVLLEARDAIKKYDLSSLKMGT